MGGYNDPPIFVDFLSKALDRYPAVTNSNSKNPPRADNMIVNPPGELQAAAVDPVQAERQEKKLAGVTWGMSFDQAREVAAAEVRPILIDFTGVNNANSRLMEKRVLPRPEVVKLLKKFVTVQLYTDTVPIASITADQRESLAEQNQERALKLTGVARTPFYVVLSPTGDLLDRIGGYQDSADFVQFLTKALEKSPIDINAASMLLPTDSVAVRSGR